ncbi:hypothetical protein C3747_84g57 [Trypanosoma cruzi]|uniref:Uncharacterized protein n=2 Tax=Trypanosoma cruzi TaxID=5693 RepID=Q4DLS8_TRYCC|nr:hypothetical protein, conserved [Trypanosoma cruzi]EAN93469.1 hypothetical protein, conserved [Trypanosoma cruzi]PWV08926.1 hypothetical protein C3747_84g57 [Trypanosoma cruzi]|eukprot:XP_815320.1 hypothetical protein [Trypanosoma cruzi strain CL Brener]
MPLDVVWTRLLARGAFFLFFTLLLATSGGAAHSLAVYPIVEDPLVGYSVVASQRCEDAGMRLAAPDSLEKAKHMESLLSRCSSSTDTVLFGAQVVECDPTISLFLFKDVFSEPSSPVAGDAELCDSLASAAGRKNVPSMFGGTLGLLFYHVDFKDCKHPNCIRPVLLDYDPAQRYGFEKPQSTEMDLLVWKLKKTEDGNASFSWEGVCSKGTAGCPFKGVQAPFIPNRVICESDGPMTDLAATCFESYVDTTEARKPVDGNLWIIVAAVGSGVLILVLLVIIFSTNSWRQRRDIKRREESEDISAPYKSKHENGNSLKLQRQGSSSGGGMQRQGSLAGGGMQRQGSFAGGGMSRQGSFAGGGMSRQGSFAGGGMPRQGSFAGGGMSRQGSFAGGEMQRQGGFSGGEMQRQGGFSGGGMQRQGSFSGGGMQRQGGFSGGEMQRQGGFSGGEMPRQTSLPGVGMRHSKSFSGMGMPRPGGFPVVGMPRPGGFPVVGMPRPGGFSGGGIQHQGSFAGGGMPRPGGFSGGGIQRQGSFSGGGMQRQGSFSGGGIQRQGSFSGGGIQRQGSFSDAEEIRGETKDDVKLKRRVSFTGAYVLL